MYVDLRSSIGRGIFMTGRFDPLVFVPIAEALAGGGHFLDIGANVGYYSVLAAEVLAHRGRVYAFEVDPRPLRCLRLNACLVSGERISVQDVAVGEESGVACLVQAKESGHTRVSVGVRGPSVRMVTIDEWCRSHRVRDIRAIKIDIEGGELAAMKGALDTLRAERPTIVFEALENSVALGGAPRTEAVTFLRDLGYEVSDVFGTHSPTLVARPRRR